MRLSCRYAILIGVFALAGSLLSAQDHGRNDSTAKLAEEPSKLPAAAKKPRKHTPSVIHEENQNKTVVPEGGAKEPPEQIAPGLAPEERERERRDAVQALGEADSDLKILANRHLSPQRQDSVKQIRYYLADARLALKEGDFRRADTLALKARLLTDDMVKH